MNKPPRRKNKPINPIVFIVLGLAVASYAIFISIIAKGVNKGNMYLFASIGGLFFLTGLIRLLKNTSSNSSIKKEELEIAKKMTGVKPTVKNERTIIVCPKCNTKNYSTSNFCHMCGARLK